MKIWYYFFRMTILWYGEACFLLEAGGTRVLIEPASKESGLAPPRLKSDILIFSKSRDNDSEAFTINSPGEYEVKGVNISGISDNENIIYRIEMDNIKVAHLGFLKKEPDNEKLELLGNPDIILVPVGGLGSELLNAESAMKLINKMEPKIAVPMLYNIKGLKIKRAPLSAFLKESEAKESPQSKLTIKKKDLTEEETKIVILEHV